MAISIYSPEDARSICRELENELMNKIYHCLVECGGEMDIEEVPFTEGAEVILVTRIYIDMDDISNDAPIYYENSEGDEGELVSISDVVGLCDIWAHFK